MFEQFLPEGGALYGFSRNMEELLGGGFIQLIDSGHVHFFACPKKRTKEKAPGIYLP